MRDDPEDQGTYRTEQEEEEEAEDVPQEVPLESPRQEQQQQHQDTSIPRSNESNLKLKSCTALDVSIKCFNTIYQIRPKIKGVQAIEEIVPF